MANLYMTAGSDTRRTINSMCGRSIMTSHLRGWNVGVMVEVRVEHDGSVRIDVWKTGGSNDPYYNKHLAMVTDKEKLRTDL